MFECNEKSTVVITASFVDENNAAVIPSSATYQIDDQASGRSILGQTSIGSLSTSVDLTISATQNRILDQANPSETRLVTVIFQYGSGKQGTTEYRYKIINLFGVSADSSTSPSGSMSPSASVSPSPG